MSLNTGNAILSNGITLDSSYNVGIGGAASGSYKLQVTGTTNLTGALTGTSATFSAMTTLGGNGENLRLTTTADSNYIAFRNSSNVQVGDIGYDERDSGGLSIWNNNASGSLVFGAGAARALTIASSGAATFSNAIDMGLNRLFSAGGYKMLYRNSSVNITYSGSLNWQINNDADSVALMSVLNSGNVGIGTTDMPYGKVSIKSNTATSYGGLNVFANGNNNFIALNHTGSVGIIETEYSTGGGHTPIALVTGGSERMRVKSNGNVGIGTNDPQRKFVVSNGGADGIELGNEGTAGSIICYNRSTNVYLPLTIQDGGGTVLIGTSSNSGQKLQVQGEIYSKGDGAILNVQARDFSLYYGFFGSTSSSLNFWSSTYGVAGTFSPSTGVYTATSDINKKKDFEASTIGLNAILGLKPTLYRMKLDEADSEKQLGFIAQEVKEFIPQAYVETDEFIGLQDRPIIAALVKAIQEMNQTIQNQQKQINSLINR